MSSEKTLVVEFILGCKPTQLYMGIIIKPLCGSRIPIKKPGFHGFRIWVFFLWRKRPWKGSTVVLKFEPEKTWHRSRELPSRKTDESQALSPVTSFEKYPQVGMLYRGDEQSTHVYIFKCCRGDFHESLYRNYRPENIWGWDHEEAIDEFLFFLKLHSGKLTVAAWNIPIFNRKYIFQPW